MSEDILGTPNSTSDSNLAPAYHVFSIKDDPDYVPGVGLLIPSGTDWSDTGHVFGSFEIAVGASVHISYGLEVETPLVDDLRMHVAEDAAWIASPDPLIGRLFHQNYVIKSAGDSLDANAASPATVTWAVRLATFGPTTADITVVRGFATFLVI